MAATHGAAPFNDVVSDPARDDQVSPGERGAVMMPQLANEQLKRRVVRACEEAAAYYDTLRVVTDGQGYLRREHRACLQLARGSWVHRPQLEPRHGHLFASVRGSFIGSDN